VKIKLLQVKESTGKQISNSAEVYRQMKEESKADREVFWALHLNTCNEIIEKEIVAIGILDSASIHPREVFKKAIINSTANIICVHNHPSGSLEPSKADQHISKVLLTSAEIIGIPLLDFIIISHKGHYSFADHGIIEEMKREAKSLTEAIFKRES